MAYSLDIRKKVIAYRATHTLEETHKVFGISKTTILDWETLQKEEARSIAISEVKSTKECLLLRENAEIKLSRP